MITKKYIKYLVGGLVISVILLFSTLLVIIFQVVESENFPPEKSSFSRIEEIGFCNIKEEVCEVGDSKNAFSPENWESIKVCGNLITEEFEGTNFTPYWKDSWGNLIASGPLRYYLNQDRVCFSLKESLENTDTLIDSFIRRDVVIDGKMKPGNYFLIIRESRIDKYILEFNIIEIP